MKVIIIGSPRAVTSMVAGLLKRCGLYMEDTLRGRSPLNWKGFYEHATFARINRRIFSENRNLPYLDLHKYAVSPETFEVMKKFVATFPKSKISGWKHVRAVVAIPAWKKAIAPEHLKVVFVKRPIEEIVESLKKTKWLLDKTDEQIKEVAESYIKTGMKNMACANGSIVTLYRNYFDDWQKELFRVVDFLKLKIPTDTAIIESFIDETLWHNRRVN